MQMKNNFCKVTGKVSIVAVCTLLGATYANAEVTAVRVGAATAAPRVTIGGTTAPTVRAATTPGTTQVRASTTNVSASTSAAASARRSSVYDYIRSNATGGLTVGGGDRGSSGVGGGDVTLPPDIDLTGLVKWEELDAEIRKLRDEFTSQSQGGEFELTNEMIDEILAKLGIDMDKLISDMVANNPIIAGKQDALTAGDGIRIDTNSNISVRPGDGLTIHNGRLAIDCASDGQNDRLLVSLADGGTVCMNIVK